MNNWLALVSLLISAYETPAGIRMNAKKWKVGIGYILAGLVLGAGLGILIMLNFGGSGNISGFIQSHLLNLSSQGPIVGKPAPDFTLVDIHGETVRLSSLHGKPVLVNFWATWCIPCEQEMPMIESAYQKEGAQFEVLAVNADEPDAKVRDYVNKMGLTFTILLDPGGTVQSQYRLNGYPSSFFIDRDGVIRDEHIGIMDSTQLTKSLLKVGVGE